MPPMRANNVELEKKMMKLLDEFGRPFGPGVAEEEFEQFMFENIDVSPGLKQLMKRLLKKIQVSY